MNANELFQRMRDGERPTGHCVKYVWRWVIDGLPCTRAVKTLESRGLITCQYYSDGASANLA